MSQQENGKVTGTVVTPEKAAIADAAVIFSKDGKSWKTRADADGKYKINLPAGIYDISTQINYWYPLFRAKISIQKNVNLHITLMPAPEVSDISLDLTGKGISEKANRIVRPKYDSFQVGDKLPNLNLVIRFYRKKKQNKYESAILTYDTTTISADKIEFDSKKFSFKATGNVFVENDGKAQQFKQVAGTFTVDNLIAASNKLKEIFNHC